MFLVLSILLNFDMTYTAGTIWLTLNGENQELISAGCAAVDSIGNKTQLAHRDQIMVMGISHGIFISRCYIQLMIRPGNLRDLLNCIMSQSVGAMI